ncbi:glycosyltransferase [Halobacillus campisalis]|uniref:4,4'-diaponeurosporenoate glycosyltransferase n=1 Tax=Halobacillus campisalis TaxID=435909 RepID=A0ABW2K3U8_9BACI|nr:glycosyltransferase family 2 protein [Halobacillus campisalis]
MWPYLYAVLLLFWVVVWIEFQRGFRRIPSIDHYPYQTNVELISVIVAAKDEDSAIHQTIQSLVEQKEVNLEIIIINDRSTDSTEPIAQSLSKRYENVKLVSIRELPEGWLGKNHALHIGTNVASGNWLVFTDADIHFKPHALARIFTYTKNSKADHVTAAPDLHASSLRLKGLISFFLFGFSYLKRPWSANSSSNKGGIGIGAFQMIKRECYEAIGGHKKIRLRPDDDLALGVNVKKAGYHQRLVTAIHLLSVEWYPNIRSALKGFEKNALAGLNYSITLAIFAVSGVFISQVLPFYFIVFGPLSVQILSVLIVILLFHLYAMSTRRFTNYPVWIILGLPFSALLFIYMLMRALLLTYLRGGIEWRNQRYSLKELKKFYKNIK